MKQVFNKKTYSGWFTSRHYLLVFVLYIFTQLGVWALDNKAPLVITGPATYTQAIPGVEVKIKVPLVRERFCSFLMSRYLIDSKGTYYDLMATRFMSEEGLRNIAKDNPTHSNFSFEVPKNAALGPATVVTQLAYMCNPLQAIWPLDFDMRTQIYIGAGP